MKFHYVSTVELCFTLFSFSQTSLGQFFDPGWGIYKPSDVKNLPGSACSRRLSTDPIAKYAMEGYIEATGNGYWVSCPMIVNWPPGTQITYGATSALQRPISLITATTGCRSTSYSPSRASSTSCTDIGSWIRFQIRAPTSLRL